MPFKWLIPECVKFDQEDIEKIIDASIRIFRTIPWRIDGTEEFAEALKNFGCRVEKSKVQFTDKVVDYTLQRIQEQKEKNSAEEKVPREASREISYSASGQAIWCHDMEKDIIRPAFKQDLADFSRVANSYPGLERAHPTFIPSDAPLKTRELHAYITIMLYSDKPYRVSCYSPEMLGYFVEANTIYYGSKEEGIKNLLLPCKVWVNTPFMISKETLEAAMKLRALTKEPLVYNPIPVCGVSTPVTYDGALVLITAEVLGINALSLALDNILAGWCTAPLGFDMKNAIYAEWSPQSVILNTAGAKIASHLFGSGTGGNQFISYSFGHSPGSILAGSLLYTSAKKPGVQSVMEKSFGMGITFTSGGRFFGALGTLADADVGSVLQLVLDMELISALKEFVKGFEVKEESIGEKIIKEVSPKGAYFLETEHTLKYFRQYGWSPELMDRQAPASWIKSPIDMLDNARKKAKQLVKNAPNKYPLNKNKRKELLTLLKIADQKLGEIH